MSNIKWWRSPDGEGIVAQTERSSAQIVGFEDRKLGGKEWFWEVFENSKRIASGSTLRQSEAKNLARAYLIALSDEEPHTMTVPKIITEHVRQPVNEGRGDWVAYRENADWEFGCGRTEEEAVADLTATFPVEGE